MQHFAHGELKKTDDILMHSMERIMSALERKMTRITWMNTLQVISKQRFYDPDEYELKIRKENLYYQIEEGCYEWKQKRERKKGKTKMVLKTVRGRRYDKNYRRE